MKMPGLASALSLVIGLAGSVFAAAPVFDPAALKTLSEFGLGLGASAPSPGPIHEVALQAGAPRIKGPLGEIAGIVIERGQAVEIPNSGAVVHIISFFRRDAEDQENLRLFNAALAQVPAEDPEITSARGDISVQSSQMTVAESPGGGFLLALTRTNGKEVVGFTTTPSGDLVKNRIGYANGKVKGLMECTAELEALFQAEKKFWVRMGREGTEYFKGRPIK
jgi:hypothetical protein